MVLILTSGFNGEYVLGALANTAVVAVLRKLSNYEYAIGRNVVRNLFEYGKSSAREQSSQDFLLVSQDGSPLQNFWNCPLSLFLRDELLPSALAAVSVSLSSGLI